MAEPHHPWPVAVLWEVLEVSRGGFSASRPRPAGAAIAAEAGLWGARIKAIAADTRPRDGTRRRAKPLQDEGGAGGRAPASRLMPQAGVVGPRPQPRGPVTPERRQGEAGAPHLRARPFDGARPEHVWGGDISDGWTAAGWLSGSTLVDWDARTGVGWAMRNRSATLLVEDTWRMARGRRPPAAGLLHPADRGSH